MDLSDPVRSVIPSLDGPVLAALMRSNAPATLTVVHARAGRGSLSGVRNVLQRLVSHGVVLQEPGGYRLNHQHLAAPAIEHLTALHARFTDALRDWLANRPEAIHAAGMFGSMARRDGSEDSDIDLVIITDAPEPDALRADLSTAILAWTGNLAQVVILSREQVRELRDRAEPIVDSWRKELEMIIGDERVVIG